jgi:hypothetical protein
LNGSEQEITSPTSAKINKRNLQERFISVFSVEFCSTAAATARTGAGGAANSWENDGEFFLRMKLELHAGVSLRRFGHIQSYHQSHVFTGEDRIWEELLRVPFNLIEKGVIMVRIVVGQDQPLDSGALRAFDPLQVA